MAFPNRKPDMAMILGIGKKPMRDEAPPSFGGKDSPSEEAAESTEGIFSCPQCGCSLAVKAAEQAAAPEMADEPEMGGEAA